MKKIIIALSIIVGVFVILIAGLIAEPYIIRNNTHNVPAEISRSIDNQEESASEIALPQSLSTDSDDFDETVSSTSSVSPSDDKNVVYITNGDVFVATQDDEKIEIHWTGGDYQDEVYSKSDNRFAQYFIDVDDETWLVVQMTIKNLGGNAVNEDIFEDYYKSIVVVYDNEYTYVMTQMDVDNLALSRFWEISPLKNKEIYFLASVPDELVGHDCEVMFEVGDVQYVYPAR